MGNEPGGVGGYYQMGSWIFRGYRLWASKDLWTSNGAYVGVMWGLYHSVTFFEEHGGHRHSASSEPQESYEL